MNTLRFIIKKLKKKLLSTTLVAMQFLLIAWLILTTPDKQVSFITGLVIATAILLAVWAVVAMRQSKLRISPVPAADAALVQNGPYKYIRHPMYSSILIAAAGLLLHYFTWTRLAIAIALLLVLLIKLYWEEKMLKEKFSGYAGYLQHTNRLVPFIY